MCLECKAPKTKCTPRPATWSRWLLRASTFVSWPTVRLVRRHRLIEPLGTKQTIHDVLLLAGVRDIRCCLGSGKTHTMVQCPSSIARSHDRDGLLID